MKLEKLRLNAELRARFDRDLHDLKEVIKRKDEEIHHLKEKLKIYEYQNKSSKITEEKEFKKS